MSKYNTIRVVELLFLTLFAYVAWCLAYEITVAARFAPQAFPGEGAARFGLLKQQQVIVLPDVFVLAPKHLIARLKYPATQTEAVVRALIALGGVAALVAGLVALRLATKAPQPFGDARFGTLGDAKRAKLLNREGVVLGRLDGVPLRVGGQGHILVVGPTRSGKGVGFVLPNLYEWEGSALILDWKEENFENSAMRRVVMGQKVYKFCPGQSDSHRYNPLDFVRRDAAMPTDCDTVAMFIVKSFEGEEIWPKAARQLVSGLIGYVLSSECTEGERHLRAVQRVMVTGEDLSVVLNTIIRTEGKALPAWVVERFRQFIAVPEKTRGSIVFNLNDAMNIWSNELISAVTQTSDFDIRNLRRDKISIYVCCNLSESRVYNLLISLLIQQIHDLNMRQRPDASDKHSVLLLLDEFYYAGRMIDVLDKVSISAGYGFRMAIVVQSISQLDAIYGAHLRTLAVSSCDVKLVMKVADEETAKQVSASLGSRTEMYKTAVIRSGGGLFGQKTYTPHYIERPLLTPAEIKEMPEDEGILTIGNARPFKFKKIRHYEHRPYKPIWVQFRNQTPEIPPLAEWIDKPNLIVNGTGERDAGKASAGPPGAERAEWKETTIAPVTPKAEASPPRDSVDVPGSPPAVPAPPDTGGAQAEPTVQPASPQIAKKGIKLAPPLQQSGEIFFIHDLSSRLDQNVQAELVDTAPLVQEELAATVDAYGEDDPHAARLLRAKRANARHKVAALATPHRTTEPAAEVEPGSDAPATEAVPVLPPLPASVEPEPFITALSLAKAANTGTKVSPRPPIDLKGTNRDETLSGLVAVLQKGGTKGKPRASNSDLG
jgi:type IV secretion system protein VirD4